MKNLATIQNQLALELSDSVQTYLILQWRTPWLIL